MTDAVILSAVRTPIAKARKGSMVDVDAFELAKVVVPEAIRRSGVPEADIDDLILAETLQGGGVIGRYIAVELGMTALPALADNRHCAAGLSAVQIAAAGIRADMDHVVVAGGTESLSSMPLSLKSIPASAGDYQQWMSPSHPDSPEAPAFDMAITVGENAARIAGLTRDDVDDWAYMTHQRAGKAVANGWFEEEIVPVEVPDGDGTRTFAIDEHPRPDTSRDKYASLSPLHPELPNATVTAGNAAGLNDAAAAVVLASDTYASASGLTPRARVRAWASVGDDPVRTGLTPIIAIPKALERAGLSVSDVDVFEINEAFCAVPVATVRELGLDPERVNVNGSGCSLGHPIACTGARMVVSMLHELERRDAQIGVVSMCAGGGMGAALVMERL